MRNLFLSKRVKPSLWQTSFVALALLLANVVAVAQTPAPPLPLREFRGAWVATVRGVDWPFEAGDPPAKQQKELIAIVEKAAAMKINALIFQVRPAGDAVYQSDLEPWSPWFTNGMGKAPSPMWDPLDFFIKAAHARGIELHAWFNPFRALSGPKYKGSGSHVSVKYPECCWMYGENLWMDPGEPKIREFSKEVILDVMRRYDVDGIHMDDYFYPYPIQENGATLPFPDNRSWKAYQTGGGTLSRSDWRRSNIDTFVQELYEGVKKEKPWVRVGISPFGIWRPNHPEGVGKGALDPYEALAADSLKWLQRGWCDYLAPQLYWPTKPDNLSFSKLFDWWLVQNTARRHIWPGIASDRVLKDRQPSEILRQISYTRARGEYMPPGHIHWSVTPLMKNRAGLADLCAERAYQDLALPPSASWLGADKPTMPVLAIRDGQAQWQYTDSRLDTFVKWWLVQVYEKGKWTSVRLLPAEARTFPVTKEMTGVAVRSISKTGISSDAAMIR